MPGVAQVVAISVGHSDEGLDGIDVLLLHFCDARASCQQGEPCQGLHVRISLQLLPRQKRGGWCFSIMGYKDSPSRLFSSTCMEKMHAILIAQRIPSRHRDATSVSSQS